MRLLAKIAAYRGDQQLAYFLSPQGIDPYAGPQIPCRRQPSGLRHLFAVFHRDSLDDLIEPLMRTIDDLTPYYQARMAWLAPEQRKIIAFVCESRHPWPTGNRTALLHEDGNGVLSPRDPA